MLTEQDFDFRELLELSGKMLVAVVNLFHDGGR
jgi:hypothetical protein